MQTPALIFSCSPVQGRKGYASTSVYEFNSMVIGEHVYKHVWTPLTDKNINTSMWEDNEHDEYTVND